MRKYFIIAICIAAIVTVTGCADNDTGFNPGDLFITDVVNVATSPEPIGEDAQTPGNIMQGNGADSGNEDSDVPLEGQLSPDDFPIFDEPYNIPEEYIAELRMIKEHLAPLYGDDFIHYQTAIGDFDMIEFDDGAISIMTSSLGKVRGVFYEFFYDLDDGLEKLHERVSAFSSSITDTEISDEDNMSIENALFVLSPDMTEPALIRVGEHILSITYRVDGAVSIVYGN
jgi:hypothetical protein